MSAEEEAAMLLPCIATNTCDMHREWGCARDPECWTCERRPAVAAALRQRDEKIAELERVNGKLERMLRDKGVSVGEAAHFDEMEERISTLEREKQSAEESNLRMAGYFAQLWQWMSANLGDDLQAVVDAHEIPRDGESKGEPVWVCARDVMERLRAKLAARDGLIEKVPHLSYNAISSETGCIWIAVPSASHHTREKCASLGGQCLFSEFTRAGK